MSNLKEKVWKIIEQYGNPECLTSYAENFLYAIEQAEHGDLEYSIDNEGVSRTQKIIGFSNYLRWDIRYLIGDCILQPNPQLFES